uniref:Uncharacterized protein n=1 Tax=Vitrella brassicaformis TaxID=1169539 RepID=A0A7S1NYE6_9ALVE
MCGGHPCVCIVPSRNDSNCVVHKEHDTHRQESADAGPLHPMAGEWSNERPPPHRHTPKAVPRSPPHRHGPVDGHATHTCVRRPSPTQQNRHCDTNRHQPPTDSRHRLTRTDRQTDRQQQAVLDEVDEGFSRHPNAL